LPTAAKQDASGGPVPPGVARAAPGAARTGRTAAAGRPLDEKEPPAVTQAPAAFTGFLTNPKESFMLRITSPRILVVDDLADAADSMAMVLQMWGYDAEVSYDGAAALATVAAYRPHIVLVDLGLPVMDGLEVARRLLARPECWHMVLIALTGYADQASRALAREAGFHHYLVKPIDLGDLQELLADYFGAETREAPMRIGATARAAVLSG
jgi:CheY-like chemotaxis protein